MARAPRTAETVLVTTHDLPLAGKLRDGFRHRGYQVDLFTASEDVAGIDEPVLLVFTGGADTADGRRQTGQAVQLGLPVFAVVGQGGQPKAPPRVSAAFSAPADPDEIVLMGTRAIERKRLREATGIVGETDAMLEVLERIVQIAPVDATVLITGESGTGKELVARGIQALSRRRHKNFIPVNVAALSETLLESELFGHEKGAFTGAIDTRKGLFELAHEGTIFLDEVGEMPPQTQTRLLRVLEQQEFHRVGGQKLIRVNVRILAATNQQLQHLVATGAFRKDLYYRLNVLTIALPPLRRRPEDIPLLVEEFIRDASQRHDRGPFRGISRDAMEILIRHRWPGNVRELRNLIESMVVLAPGRRIRAEDIPQDVRSGDGPLAIVPVMRGPARDDGGTQSIRPQLEFIFRTMMEMKVDIEDLKREFEDFQAGERGTAMLIARATDSSEAFPPEMSRQFAPADEPLPSAEIVYDRRQGGDDAGARPDDPDARTDDPDARTEDPDARTDDSDPWTGKADTPLADPDAWPEEVDPRPDGPEPAEAAEADAASSDASPGTVAYRPGMTLEELERDVIRSVLDSVEWNRRQAAEILGIGERTLYRKVRKFGLEEDGAGES